MPDTHGQDLLLKQIMAPRQTKAAKTIWQGTYDPDPSTLLPSYLYIMHMQAEPWGVGLLECMQRYRLVETLHIAG
jgi:hypothetical protein